MIKDVIITNRLILKSIQKEDCHDLLDILNSDEVGRFINKIDNLESVEKLIARKIEKYKINLGESFSVVEKASLKVIGNFELKINETEKYAEISYVFNDNFWNRGYATESALAVIDYVRNNLDVDRIIADCLENNLSSCHILKDKLKMEQIGVETRIDKTTNKPLNYLCFELHLKNNTLI